MKHTMLPYHPYHSPPRKLDAEANPIQAKPTHQNIIRLAPPLVITEEEIKTALGIIEQAVKELPTLTGASEDKVIPPPEKKVKIGLEN